MPRPTRSIYAVDPDSQKVRLVLQVTPDGWSEEQLDKLFGGLIPVLGDANIPVAIVVSHSTAFTIRFESRSKHFDIDEVDPAEVLAPIPLDPDPENLFDSVRAWAHSLADDPEGFAPKASLTKRLPEIVPLITGAKLRDRDGSIGIPSELVSPLELPDD